MSVNYLSPGDTFVRAKVCYIKYYNFPSRERLSYILMTFKLPTSRLSILLLTISLL